MVSSKFSNVRLIKRCVLLKCISYSSAQWHVFHIILPLMSASLSKNCTLKILTFLLSVKSKPRPTNKRGK